MAVSIKVEDVYNQWIDPALLLLGEFLERLSHDKSGDTHMNIFLKAYCL